jgi:acyl carrier protein
MNILSAGPTSRDRLISLVRQMLAADGLSGPLSCDDRLTDVGLTSLDMVNLMFAVEGEFGIEIPQADITLENFESLASIETLVARLTRASNPSAD